ncbi:MAG: porin [Planctomycetota bacterium]|nr:porin [Planctomycetota bacterium]
MRSHFVISAVAVLLALAVFASPASADDDLRATIRDEISKWSEANDDNTFKVHWKNGLRLDSKNVKMKIGGRIMIDHWFVDDDDLVAAAAAAGQLDDEDYESGVEWRRLRLYNAGKMFKHVEWKLQLDFANPDEPELRDAYFGLIDMDDCLGCAMPNIRIGHFKVPFSLNELTSSKYITFMERADASSVFAPGRRYQVMLHDSFRGGQLNYAFSYWLTEGVDEEQRFEFDNDEDAEDGYGFAGRITYTPWYDCECSCRRLHVGVGAYAVEDITEISFSADGYSRVGDTIALVDTNNFPAEALFAWNVELALVYGPFSLQAEYYSMDVDSPQAGDPTFTSWYAMASYWLTGECRNYKKGVFSRVSPCCNFLDNDCCCYGGIEIAVRYDFVDLSDGAIQGGELTHFVVGVNWHLNPNARVMINWFTTSTEGNAATLRNLDEDYTGIGVRLQVDW